jgi:MoaA/NifB/PqqE/SkfB family radical SAM enzyme
MHDLIVSPFLTDYLVLRPGSPHAVKIPRRKYAELRQAAAVDDVIPSWLVDAARRAWEIDVSGQAGQSVLVRDQSPFGYGRASYELNLGCNYDCDHCYLGQKKFQGLSWPDRERLLYILRDAGVLWLQLTGGEPMIDNLFPDVYGLAFELGMMLSISTNGSRLWNPKILDLLRSCPPYRLTVSVYGATAESYDSLTRRRGSFAAFSRGLTAAHAARLPIKLSLVVTRRNAHEIDKMRAMAEGLGLAHAVYTNMSPTIYGGAESLPAQSQEHLRKRKPFAGCNAGHTFFHVDPHGMASICKIGRDPRISLMDEGIEGLHRLGGIADSLMLRTGGCSGCALSGTCWTCRPLAKLYQDAKAPLHSYCQHGRM